MGHDGGVSFTLAVDPLAKDPKPRFSLGPCDNMNFICCDLDEVTQLSIDLYGKDSLVPGWPTVFLPTSPG